MLLVGSLPVAEMAGNGEKVLLPVPSRYSDESPATPGRKR
jgi:hypothetical protein